MGDQFFPYFFHGDFFPTQFHIQGGNRLIFDTTWDHEIKIPQGSLQYRAAAARCRSHYSMARRYQCQFGAGTVGEWGARVDMPPSSAQPCAPCG